MRPTARLLAPLLVLALAGCTGGGDESTPSSTAPTTTSPEAQSVPVEERFLTDADAPATQPDPVETRVTVADLEDFMTSIAPELFIDLDAEGTTTALEEAGFTWAAVDTRFFGEAHQRSAPHVFGVVIELASEEGAKSVLDLLQADTKKPCPESCAVQISDFEVDDIPDARGVHRLSTAQLIKTSGTPEQVPSDSYWIGFTEGSIVYAVDVQGSPGSVTEEQAQEIADAYHDRLAAS